MCMIDHTQEREDQEDSDRLFSVVSSDKATGINCNTGSSI